MKDNTIVCVSVSHAMHWPLQGCHAGTSLAKMFGVVAIGMPLTLLSTAQVAFLVRKYVQTEMLDAPTAAALPPFGKMHFITWGMCCLY